MNKITAKSEYGFKTAPTGDIWIKCDRKLIASDTFKSLKKGDNIDFIETNGKGFVTSFTLINHNEMDCPGDNSPQMNTLKNQTSSIVSSRPDDSFNKESADEIRRRNLRVDSSVSDQILKGQSLNLVFNTYFALRPDGLSKNIASKDARREAIELSNKLYQELKASKMEEW